MISVKSAVLYFTFLISGSFVFANVDELPSQNFDFDSLVELMQGEWRGMAVKTPVGPMEYNINYTLSDNGLIGVADTGSSYHHWQFVNVNNKLKLKFLSTFRGNTKPRYLEYSHTKNNKHFFHHLHPDYLRIQITPGEGSIELHIILRGESHVKIELNRKPVKLATLK